MLVEKLVSYLDVPDNDCWYDSGCELARNFIDENYETIFELLALQWRNWSELVQTHLAYILGERSTEGEIQLVRDLATSQYEEVVLRAKEAYSALTKTEQRVIGVSSLFCANAAG